MVQAAPVNRMFPEHPEAVSNSVRKENVHHYFASIRKGNCRRLWETVSVISCVEAACRFVYKTTNDC